MKKDPLIFVKHILNSIKEINFFSKGISEGEFLESSLIQSAVIRQLEIIGEATKNLPLHFRKMYAFVEWAKIAGLRDKIIHHYFGIDLEIIWVVIKKDLPKLKKDIEKILKDF